MLKDNFSRKPKKVVPPRRIEPPPGLPELDPSAGLPPVAPPTGSGTQSLSDSQTLASLALGRLSDAYASRQPSANLLQPAAPASAQPAVPDVKMTAGRFQQLKACELSGQVINQLYEVKGQLGRGGMGQVLLCRNLRREIDVVMKLMLSEADAEDKNFKRFTQECKAAHRIQHPNVVTVMDYGILLDTLQPYLVMEFIDGFSLRQLLKQNKTLAADNIAEVLIQACNGLHEVHGRGVIHRDLKPDNLMIVIEADVLRNVKILDFGIAQLQRKNAINDDGLAVGSVLYMSPEQACGKEVDQRTDIYSLGAILYESICGAPPFFGNSATQTMSMHVTKAPTPPSAVVNCPKIEWVDAICLRALAKNPADRYQSVIEMQMDLAQLLN